LCRTVVEDSVALLFSEGHFPSIDSDNPDVRNAFASIVKETQLNRTMVDAAMRGAVGSVALLLRVLKGRIFVDVLDTTYLTALWSPSQPDMLASVTERYKVAGAALVRNGYKVEYSEKLYWFTRTWDTEREIWYRPAPVGEATEPVIDESRTVSHKLSMVPIIWIRNLPGRSFTGDPCDGACTFSAAMHIQVEIDYQLSQVGRGLKYNSDPTLLLKDSSIGDGDIIKGAGNALVLSEKGDARLLEIGGTAASAVMDYVRTLRELALESIHGNRANPDRITAAQSGRALEMLNQGLIWLADNLRTTYGEAGLLQLARLIVRASQVYKILSFGHPIGALDPKAIISLKWPRWYAPTAEDRHKDVQSLTALLAAGCIDRETAMRAIAHCYDIETPLSTMNPLSPDGTAQHAN
jgi:hypothetical protein